MGIQSLAHSISWSHLWVGTFCTHYQYLYTDQEGMLCYFPKPSLGKPFNFSHGSEARVCGLPFSPKADGQQPMMTKEAEMKNRVLTPCMTEMTCFQDQLQRGNSLLLGLNQGLCSLGAVEISRVGRNHWL